MTLKITLKSPTTLKHHWNHTENLYKKSQCNFLLITLTLCLLVLFKNRILHIYNHTETYWKIFSIIHALVLSIFSVALVFQCDFQCHILIVTIWATGLCTSSQTKSKTALDIFWCLNCTILTLIPVPPENHCHWASVLWL